MKKIFLIFLFFNSASCIFNCASSQNPLIKIWDKRYGGDAIDRLFTILQTSDGGFLLGGFSESGISGDKTQSVWGVTWDNDYWIVKTDSLGNKQWDKDFGGIYDDYLLSTYKTADGGIILGGYSLSGVSGDKTQPTQGGTDYWIIKIDSFGTKEWDKSFGGSDLDVFSTIQQTNDGGYILGGYSFSGSSGDKSEPSWGNYDYWIIKTDSLGNKQWDKDFGASDNEKLNSIQQTSDRGYILGGYSSSNIGGNKTQPSWGGADYWIVKTDSSGNIQWDKTFGGTNNDEIYSLQQASDGGFILAGLSYSGISGDKTQPVWGVAGTDRDYWIVKTDSLGNKQWDKDFGGTGIEDFFGNIMQLADGGYLVTGLSNSSISGNKTENNLGIRQTWVLNIDSVGNVIWDKTIFTSGEDEQGRGIQTKDGCYVMANYSSGGIAGYKTQDAWNNSPDYWMVKFCDSTIATNSSSFSINENEIIIFPNPVTDMLSVKCYPLSGTATEISIYNFLGEKVLAAPLRFDSQLLTLDCRALPAGIYYIEMVSDNKIFRTKFLKQ